MPCWWVIKLLLLRGYLSGTSQQWHLSQPSLAEFGFAQPPHQLAFQGQQKAFLSHSRNAHRKSAMQKKQYT